ncbi:MAG: hypothetical protein A2W25_16875 [candidate division Zixibacteria bacterium RBG_16_53_22]|nr:MAG: hypothetical protein A2W25_16875 [candidate division Zixibacteria bacterium RBG_16_53_22]
MAPHGAEWHSPVWLGMSDREHSMAVFRDSMLPKHPDSTVASRAFPSTTQKPGLSPKFLGDFIELRF